MMTKLSIQWLKQKCEISIGILGGGGEEGGKFKP